MTRRSVFARFREPKWRHGKLGALLTASFLLICVLLNIGVSTLEEEYGWRRDMSFNGYATTSEETQATLDRVTKPVELYLLYQSGQEDVQVLQVLNRYKVMCDYITVLPTDIAKNPGILTRFTGDEDSSIAADTVVVSCPDTGRYKALSYNDFLASGYNVDSGAFELEGLAYEKKLTEAIVYVSRDEIPTVGLLQGHGELTMDTLQNLVSYFQRNNFDSRTINLLNGDTLEGVDILLIAGPQKDLSDGEIETVSAFAQNDGSLFVMRDYTDPLDGMPNYMALLRSYGVIPLPGVAVAGEEETESYYGEQLYLLPYMAELDMTLPLISSGYDILLMPAACAFEAPAAGDQSLTVETVLKTGSQAYLRSLSDGVDSIEKQAGDREGELTLALYARRMHSSGNISRMFAIGNSAMFIDEYIYQSTFNEEFITAIMKELAPESGISLDIMAASAFRPALTAGSQTLGVVLLVLLPMLTIILALCVLLPRNNR